mgnify:FL=1
MTFIKEFLFLLIPVLIIVATVWVFVKYYLKTEKEKLIVKIGLKNKEIITPVRLQAYERLVLLLERMELSQVILRNVSLGQTAAQLQQMLMNNIKEEFDHNLSQQLYISSEAWDLIKKAHDSIIASINDASSQLKDDASASDLAQLIFQSEANAEQSQTKRAMEYLKNEARLLF